MTILFLRQTYLPPPVEEDLSNESIQQGPLTFDPNLPQAKEEGSPLAAANDQAELMHWHYRLGHLTFDKLKQLALNGKIPKKLDDHAQLQQAITEIQGSELNIKDQGHPADYVGVSIKKLRDDSCEFIQRALIDSIIEDIRFQGLQDQTCSSQGLPASACLQGRTCT